MFIVGRCGLEHLFRSGESHNARERGRRILDGMRAGGDLQQAIWRELQAALRVRGRTGGLAASLEKRKPAFKER